MTRDWQEEEDNNGHGSDRILTTIDHIYMLWFNLKWKMNHMQNINEYAVDINAHCSKLL